MDVGEHRGGGLGERRAGVERTAYIPPVNRELGGTQRGEKPGLGL